MRRNVALIDLYEESTRLVRELGEMESRKLYMHVEPGVYPDYPEGRTDDAHTREAGARAYAGFAAEKLKKLALC